MERLKACLDSLEFRYDTKRAQDSYGSEDWRFIIYDTDNNGDPFSVAVMPIIHNTELLLVGHYLPGSVGRSVHDFDNKLLSRHTEVYRVSYEYDDEEDEYRVKGNMDYGQHVEGNKFLAVWFEIKRLMSFRRGDIDDSIDPPVD